MRTPNTISFVSGVVILVIIATACAAIEPARPMTKIGLAGPFEGQYRYVGYEAMYAARLALREANATGGAGGYSVELVAFDDQGTSAGARTAARNLVLDPSVTAVIGHFRDESSAAARAFYDDAGMRSIDAGIVDGFGDHEADAVCRLLLRVASQYPDTCSGEGPNNVAEQAVEPVHVQWVTDHAAVPHCDGGLFFTTGSEIPPAEEIDLVYLALDPVEAAETVRALREADWRGSVVGGPSLGSPLFAQVGYPQGVIFGTLNRWPDISGSDAAFAAGYASLGPHVPAPGPIALSTYEATRRLLEEIEQVTSAGVKPTRHNLAAFPEGPQPGSLFVYRWLDEGTPELIDEIPLAD